MANLSIYLTDETYRLWETLCESQDLKPGTAGRQLIEEQVRAQQAHVLAALAQRPALTYAGPNRRITIRLSDREVQAIQQHLDVLGGSRSQWIVRQVRAALSDDPQLYESDLHALIESNYHLATISRNLNQLTGELLDGHEPESMALESVRSLISQIEAHTAVVNRLIQLRQQRGSH